MAIQDVFTGVRSGLAIKAPCVSMASTNLTLSGEQTVAGVACVEGDRVFAGGQTDASQIGIYVVATGAWARAQDFDGADDVTNGTLINVAGGTNAGLWRVSCSTPVVIETTTFTVTNVFFVGTSGGLVTILGKPNPSTETVGAEAGSGRTGNGISFIDLIGDATYTDYGMRMVREAGANAFSSILHRGTGPLRFETQEASEIRFLTTGVQRMQVAAGSHTLTVGPSVTTDTVTLNLGNGRSSDGISRVRLIGDATYTSGGLEIQRGNAGANANSDITHRGTGNFSISATEAGLIRFLTSNVERVRFAQAAHTTEFARNVGADTVSVVLAQGRTVDGISQIQLIGDSTYSAGGLTLVRNAGSNGGSSITNRGTGGLTVSNTESAPITLTTNSLARVAISGTSYVTTFGGAAVTDTVGFEMGTGRTGLGSTYIDMVTDNTTYTDFGLRIIRSAAVNATTDLIHRGTGNFTLAAQDAAAVRMTSNGTLVLNATSTGVSFAEGIDFGATLAPGGAVDLSKHIALYGAGGGFGFTVTASSLNIVSAASSVIAFYPNNALQFTMTSDGRFYGANLHNNAGSMTGVTNQYVGSGTYTPTLTNVTNVAASTAAECQWMRVGNVVTVSGHVNVDPTAAATNTELGMSLPIASNFSATSDLGGAGSALATAGEAFGIIADVANDRAAFQSFVANAANHTVAFSFTYEVKA